MRFREAFASLFVGSGLLLALPATLAAVPTPKDLFAAVSGSVVVVKAYDAEKAVGFGSGVVITQDEVLTNCHVLEKGSRFRVGRGKDLRRAVLLYRDKDEDKDKDLCLKALRALLV